MKRRLQPFWLVSLLLMGIAFATTYEALDLDTILTRSDLAFHGAVTATTVIEEDGEPWTVVTFEVLEVFKGEPEDMVELSFLGGQLPGRANVVVTGMPQFTVGERVLVFAYDAPYYSPIVGFNQGLWRQGPRGFEDETGRLLSLSDEGELLLEGEGGGDDEVLAALRERLGGF